MPDQAATDQSEPSSGTARYVRALRVPVAVLCLIATVLVAYFLLYVRHETDYLVGRNFRVLATAAVQIEATLESASGVIGNLRQHDSDRWETTAGAAKRSGSIPILSFVIDSYVWPDMGKLVPRLKEPAASTTWYLSDDPANDQGILPRGFRELPLDLNRLLQQLMASNARAGLFDSVLVTTNTGRVMFQAGDATLRLTTLDKLRNIGDKGADQKLPLDAMTGSSNVVDVMLAGGAYKLFVEPCCQSVHTLAGGGKSGERGWMVCGLVSQAGLNSAGYAVSFSFMALVIGALFMAVFSWPFVKLTLIGPLQRVRLHDVVLVGICALLGGALVTLFVLDLYSYSKLEADLDGQLETFASSVDTRVTEEVDTAVKQLRALDRAVPQLVREGPGPQVPYLAWYQSIDFSSYPLFESFSLVDLDGVQKQKWTLGEFVPPLISVRDREYFAYWQSPIPGDSRFVAAVRSKTTGNRELVVSVPSVNAPAADAHARNRRWVATLAIQEFRSLLDATVVPGFGFAVVSEDGELLFHSDPQHAVSENVFAETDNNRRLRALVSARQTGWLNMRYWGEDYRAFVRPMSGDGLPNWSLITFYDRRPVRTVNAEWLVTTIFFLMLYASSYVSVSLGIHVWSPAYRAPWLWPDPTRSRAYVELLLLELLLITGWVAGLSFFSNTELLWSAWLLPFVAWCLAYLVLALPRRDHAARPVVLLVTILLVAFWLSNMRQHLVAALAFSTLFAAVAMSRRWLPDGLGWARELPILKFCYGGAAVGCAVLTIVLPTASFFKIAHGIQTESFVKYGQLKLALAAREREARHQQRAATLFESLETAPFKLLDDKRRELDKRGVYDDFFFTTKADSAASCSDPAAASQDLPDAFEERLPYFSESSVAIRELIHDRAPGRWRWCQQANQLVMMMEDGGERYRSELPRLLGWASPHWPLPLEIGGIVAGFLVLAVTVAWGVRFVMHHVFVIDLVDPLWAPTVRVPVTAGANLLLLPAGPLDPAFVDRANYVVLDLGAVTLDDVAGWERERRAELERAEEWKNVLVEHVERTANDLDVKGATMRLLDYAMLRLNRTVMLVSMLPASRLIRAGAVLADSEAEQRWAQLLTSFAPVPIGSDAGDALPSSWRAATVPAPVLGTMLWRASMGFLPDEGRDLYVGQAWRRLLPEGRSVPLDASQLLVEADERLDGYYRLLWDTCTPEQRLVLLQIAQERLVNEKNRRIVRLLMARRLIMRSPNIRLASETFRRFVLSASVGTDAMAIEGRSTSTWDTVRWPFMAMLVATVGFFFTTQHELFNSTLGIVTGVAAGVPTILKVMSLFGEKRGQV